MTKLLKGFGDCYCAERGTASHSQNPVTKSRYRYRELRDRGSQTRPGY